MLLEMREQYGEILLKRWNITFRYSLMFMQQIDGIPVCTFNEDTMHVALSFPFLVIRVHRVLGPLHTHTRALMLGCGKLPHPGFEVLQPARERKSFKADVRNILYPSEWVAPFKDWVHLYLCVCVCFCVFGLRCHCFSITFVQWHQWDWEWEWTNKHTHSLVLTHTYRHTQTHTREATGMLCCIVGEGALSGSRPLHGTLERPNSEVPARVGVVK